MNIGESLTLYRVHLSSNLGKMSNVLWCDHSFGIGMLYCGDDRGRDSLMCGMVISRSYTRAS